MTLSLDVEVDELIAKKHARCKPAEVAAGDGNRIGVPGGKVERPDHVDGFRRTDARFGNCSFGIRVCGLVGRPAKCQEKRPKFPEQSVHVR